MGRVDTASRYGVTVSDASISASTTFDLEPNTVYRLACVKQPIMFKFGASVTATDADALVLGNNAKDFVFDSGASTQLSVIEVTAGAIVSLTKVLRFGESA